MAMVVLDRVFKRYSESVVAVDNVSLQVNDREFLVLVGPSGCGKSTTLRLISGLETCDQGEIWIGGRRVDSLPAKDRDLAMVFQNYALYPHMSVYKNLSFGLELRFGGGIGARVLRRIFRPRRSVELNQLRRGISQRVQLAARRLGIEHLLQRRPHQLSGGERQRVALGRAIVREPAAFLFDEPLSNLDAKLRAEMRVEMKRLHRELGATMIYVTHDQTEAMTLGDRITVMNRGRIEQTGTPAELYRRPANRFVAEFIGSQSMNMIAGNIVQRDDRLKFEADGIGWTVDCPRAWAAPPGPVWMGFRPEHVQLKPRDTDPQNSAFLVEKDWLGDASIAHLEFRSAAADAVRIQARVADCPWPTQTPLSIEVDMQHVHWFDRASGNNLIKA